MKEQLNFTKKSKRIIALALVLVLCLAMVPIGTMASTSEGEYSTCPYCGEELSGNWTFSKVAGELTCDSEEHITQSECEACAEYADLEWYICTEEVDSIGYFDDDNNFITDEQEHVHGEYCYVECTNADCSHNYDYTCVVPCTINHEAHNDDCYTSSYCVHTEITIDDIEPLGYTSTHMFGWDVEENANDPGISVYIGNTLLTRQNTTTFNVGAVRTSAIKIVAPQGYYVSGYYIVCNNNGTKYNCSTYNHGTGVAYKITGLSAGSDPVIAANTISDGPTGFGHTSNSSPYWLIVQLAQDARKYTVTYNNGSIGTENFTGKTVPIDSTQYSRSSNFTVKSPTDDAVEAAAELDYRFSHWSVSDDSGTGEAGTADPNDTKTITGNMTLTACWVPNTYSVTYQWASGSLALMLPNGASGLLWKATHTVAADYVVGEQYYLTGSDVPYTFLGWKLASGSTEPTGLKTNAEGYITSESLTMPKGNVVLEGHLAVGNPVTYSYEIVDNDSNPDGKKQPPEVKVTDLPNGGATQTTYAESITVSDKLAPIDDTNAAGLVIGTWTFNEWTANTATYTGLSYSFDGDDVTFKGTYSYQAATSYSLSYDLNTPANASDLYGVAAPGPVAPLYDTQEVDLDTQTVVSGTTKIYGYIDNVYGSWTFAGWATYEYGTSTGNVIIDNKVTMPASNVKIYGSWGEFTPLVSRIDFAKTFVGITDKSKIPDNYYVVITNSRTNTTIGTYSLSGMQEGTNYGSSEVSYYWTILNFPVEVEYTVIEYNYEIDGYTWSSSSFDQNGVYSGNAITYKAAVGEGGAINLWNNYDLKYQVSYEWETKGGYDYDPDELPTLASPQKFAPDDDVAFAADLSYDFKIAATETASGQAGYLVFDGWDVAGLEEGVLGADYGFKMPSNDVTFTGKLKFVPVYSVTYEFKFPAGISVYEDNGFPPTLTQDSGTYAEGTAVEFKNSLSFSDVHGTLDGVPGTFEFVGWVEDTSEIDKVKPAVTFTMPGRDVKFVAQFEFVEDTYTLTYNFVGEADVIARLATVDPIVNVPAVELGIAYNSSVTVASGFDSTGGTSIILSDGVLFFDGWYDKDPTTDDTAELITGFENVNDNMEVYGKWTYKDYHTVTYQWLGEEGVGRPSEALLTTSGIALPAVEKYTEGENVDVYFPSTVIEVTDGSGFLGYWVFKGWQSDDVTGFDYNTAEFEMPNENVLLSGEWEFVQLVIEGITRVYDTNYYGVTILVDDYSVNDGSYQYRYSYDNGVTYGAWVDTETRLVDVGRVYVQVRAMNEIAHSEDGYRYSNTVIVEVTQRPITITANSARYRYTGAMRYVTDYSITSGSLATNASGVAETYTASAYGSGRGVSGGTRTYTVYMGQDENGSTVATRIYKTNGTDSTSNYAITLRNGTLEIWDTTNSYTPPTTTTTTTTPATTATVSLADPPAYQTIGDTTTPLAQAPDTVDIADESVPLGPVTGDVNPIAILICLLVISGAAIVIVGRKRFGKSN